MGRNKFIIALLTITTIFATSSFAQKIDADMLAKAKMLGISESEIKQQMSKYQGVGEGEVSSTVNRDNQYELREYETDEKNSLNGRIGRSEMGGEFDEYGSFGTYEERMEYLMNQSLEANAPKKLEIYGHDMFKNDKITYEPNLNIPTPENYVLSIGDEVIINIWGDSESIIKETISPEGLIYIPNLGPIHINGMTAPKARAYVERELSKINESIGTTSQITLSIGQIRSIKVNITGEVDTPGAYTVPSLATLFHVLHISGGTTEIGDLRKIEVFRDSKRVAVMDVYDFIMNGDISNNIILRDGDVVVVPPYSAKVSITGEIKRPMCYLMKDGESVNSLIKYAGSFAEDAYKNRVKVFRKGGEYNEVITVESDDFNKIFINNGDSVVVERAKDEFLNRLQIDGAVWYPGDFQLNEKTNTLSKLIQYAGGLRGNAFAKSAIIERRNSDYTKSFINFNPTDVVSGKNDITLQNYDEILIPTLDSLQEEFTIIVLGEVNTPDTIEYRYGMRIEDAIILAGGLKESASLSVIDVSRRLRDNRSTNYTEDKAELFSFNINEDLSLTTQTKGFSLTPYDIVVVRKSPNYKEQTTITITGEVVMPGNYTIEQEQTYLSDVLQMTKGATPFAYIKGANLVRWRDDSGMDLSLNKLQESMSGKDSMSINMDEIRSYPVAINLEEALLDPRGDSDILLQKGDVINIPKLINIVNTNGALYYPNASTYVGHRLKRYIQSSGGYTKEARKRPFVVYKNGTVKATKVIFFIKKYPRIEPGCLIVVPMKSHVDKASLAEIIGIASTTASMAASMGTLGLSISNSK